MARLTTTRLLKKWQYGLNICDTYHMRNNVNAYLLQYNNKCAI